MIDAHTHVWLKNDAYPYQPTLKSVPLPTTDAPIDDLLARMTEAGVPRAVLVQPAAFGWDNRYLADSLAGRRETLAASCLVDPSSPTAPADLARWHAAGFSAVRINLIDGGSGEWLYGDSPTSLLRAAAELHLTVLLQPLLHQIPVIARVAGTHPDLDFVVDYLGPHAASDPAALEAVQLLAALDNVTMKLLALPSDSREPYPFGDLVALYRRILGAVGPTRIVLGTDYPNCLAGLPYGSAIEWLRDEVCSRDAAIEQAADATAVRLFFKNDRESAA